MNPGTQAFWFLKSTNFIRSEIRKATKLPAQKMVPRLRELLGRQEALGREVAKFLEEKDSQ
jgi:hypothetical protein